MVGAARAEMAIAGGMPEASPASDAELVDAAKRDITAFEPLYRRYVQAVYRYCWRRVGEREAADATSVVFTRALAGLADYREGSFRAWLFAIAHNVTVNHLRDTRPGRPLDEAVDVADPAVPPEDAALAEEERRSVSRLVARLPLDYRTVVELRLAGLTGPEIACVIGRSHAAVRLLQHRALVRLRELADGDPDLGGA